MSSIPATIHAADLAPGDHFLDPDSGRSRTVVDGPYFASDEDSVIVRVAGPSGRLYQRFLDPTALVNLEARS